MLSYQPLDSYRMAKLTAAVPCYVCGSPNTYDTDLCLNCLAPMALAHQAITQKLKLQMIAVLGCAGSGKTVYLGMLSDILSQPGGDLHLLMRGAFSIRLQQNTIAALAEGRFPSKTPSEPDRWNWMHAQVQAPQRRTIDLVVPDIAGEALLEEIDHPRTFPVVRPFLAKCAGAILLIDAVRIAARDPEHDFAARKVVDFLCEVDDHAKTGWPARPIACVLAKADQVDAAGTDPAAFVRDAAHGLWRTAQARLRKVRYFSASVAGACAFTYDRFGKVTVPLRIEPRGVVEPFAWLMDELPKV